MIARRLSAYALLGLLGVINIVLTLTVTRVQLPETVGPVLLLMRGVALVCALVVVLRRRVGAWWWITAGFFMLLISQVLYSILAGYAFIGLIRLSAAPLIMIGLLRLPRQRGGGLEPYKAALDVALVVLAGAMALWCFSIGPALVGHDADAVFFLDASILPLSELMILTGLAIAVVRGVDPTVRIPFLILATGFLFEMAGNVGGDSDPAMADYPRPHQFLLWSVGHTLMAGAAFAQTRRRPQTGKVLERSAGVSLLPYIAAALGAALTVAAALVGVPYVTLSGLVVGMAAITGAVLARQMLAMKENHRMAVTDGLTGLSNRAHFEDMLALALVRARRNRQVVGVVLCDLNFFKEVNDSLGHAAGDRMLIEFGGMLRRAVLGHDPVGRLGGDEFGVVLHNIATPDNAEAVIARIREEMETPILVDDNTPIQIRAAIGYALSDPATADADSMLKRADEAMYRNKRESRSVSSRSAR